ncbi:White ABC transporter [Encephalitozoon intestinalis ATCC 50506]|uniref:White ABC transporter n=1 Tax=Encephalitozoon intestinalis (strain ATCC 50506) TaxID=876142 RepID=E0S9T8_ENCIT|nr:White ABC transporter [Encephalitozoon intestinalis ATCC 50506]ADM12473.1 White ABC transporter [Encephalitozoon intestinalis ATCC 50506]UTX46310.1 sterolin-1 [Encephalitozoon intestinalis]
MQEKDLGPIVGYNLELKDIFLEAPNKDLSSSTKYVRLINGISTTFESGKLSVIMGPSGSSKTTLINLIVGIIQENSKVSGNVLLRGKSRNPKTWLTQVAYLNQDDCIVPYITIHEYIYFCVSCRTTKKQRGGRSINEIINKVMKKLHIEDLKDVVMTAISGGERKRVMIAVEFAVSPEVLILDEPTSGLDSHLAFELIQMIKEYAVENNKIVITTVHQPGPGLFDMFDYLLFLNKGSLVYSGSADQCERFFDSKGIHRVGNLSVSEFLFELFSGQSYISGIEEYREAINKMIESAVQEGDLKIENKTMSQISGSVVKLPFSFSKALKIAKRKWIMEWRSWRMMRNWIFEIVFLFVYVYFLYPMIFSIEFLNFKNLLNLNINERDETESVFRWLIGSLKSMIDESLVGNVDEAIKWEICSFLLITLSLFGSTDILDGLNYVHRETSKATYGISTLYFSTWIAETPITILKCFVFLGISSSIGIHGGNTFELITYIIVGSLLILAFDIMMRSITSSSAFRKFLSMITFIFLTSLTPEISYTFTKILSVPSAGNLRLLKLLKYPSILLWPQIFFQGFMRLSFFERVMFPKEPNEKFTFIYKAIMGSIVTPRLYDLHLSDEENREKLLNPQTRFLVDQNYSKYILLPLGATSLIIVILLSNYFLVRRFSPRLQLNLSNK